MADRVRWETYRGKQILRVDYSGLRGPEFLPVMDQVRAVYKNQPRGSMLAFTDLRNSYGTDEVVEGFKKLASVTKLYDKKSAIIGVTGVKAVLLRAVTLFSQHSLKAFDDEKQALDWLVA